MYFLSGIGMAAKLRGLALKQVIRSFTKPATISKDSSSRVRQFHSSKRLLTTANHGMSILESEIDRYGSVKVDVGKLSVDLPEENFHQLLKGKNIKMTIFPKTSLV